MTQSGLVADVKRNIFLLSKFRCLIGLHTFYTLGIKDRMPPPSPKVQEQKESPVVNIMLWLLWTVALLLLEFCENYR